MEINTLVDDIYALFDPEKQHEIDEDNLEEFANTMKEVLRAKLGKRPETTTALRFSSLGRGDRQIWYDSKGTDKEALSPKTYFKFLYGDVIEAVILFLAKEAGHSVERQQEEINVDGVLGHIDAVIDGYVIDVKSASPYGYKKFKDGMVTESDTFGYVDQLSGYASVLTPERPAAFLAFDKVSGDICLSWLSQSVIADHPPEPRIGHLKKVLASPTPPPRCYEDEEDGKSGNRKLGVGCSYCHHKFNCWDGLRGFAYSNGPRYLTRVVKTPDVYEIKGP